MFRNYTESLGFAPLLAADQKTSLKWYRKAAEQGVAQADPDFTVRDLSKQLLDERLADFEKNPDIGIPWSQVRANALRELGKK